MTTRLNDVKIWIDGACSGNPGPGGWAALVTIETSKGLVEKMLSGCYAGTTNNQMEVAALGQSIDALRYECNITIYTDSNNLIGWMSKGWKRKDQFLRDMLNEIDEKVKKMGHKLTFVKVDAHSGDKNNDRVDAEACKQRDIAKSIPLVEKELSPLEVLKALRRRRGSASGAIFLKFIQSGGS